MDGMSSYQEEKLNKAWTTLNGQIAQARHVLDEGPDRQAFRLASVENPELANRMAVGHLVSEIRPELEPHKESLVALLSDLKALIAIFWIF